MPTNTKFSQRNSAAGTMTGSQLAKKAGSGQMSAKEIADQVMRANKNRNAPPAKPTKTSTATKASGSNVKPSTTKTTATKSMKTQNIPEVTVSVTKKKAVETKPVTPPVKEKGKPVTDFYVVSQPGGGYKELTYNEYKTYKGPGKGQVLKSDVYEKNKDRITTLKKTDPAKN